MRCMATYANVDLAREMQVSGWLGSGILAGFVTNTDLGGETRSSRERLHAATSTSPPLR